MEKLMLRDFAREIFPQCPNIPYGYNPYNPSILTLPNGNIVMNVRMTNYFYKGNFMTKTTITHHGPRYSTKNILCCYHGDDFSLLWQRPIEDCWGKYFYNRCYEHGLQDMRLFLFQGELRFIATVAMIDPEFKIWVYEGSLGLVEDLIPSTEPLYIISLYKLEGPQPDIRCEKNWLPMNLNGEQWYIYHIGKEVWLQAGEAGEIRKLAYKRSPDKVRHPFSGSSPPIPYKDGFLLLGHKVLSPPNGKGRIYKHCFIRLDSNGRVIDYSKFFSLWQLGVEYALSMTWWKGEILIPFSLNDNDIRFFVLDPCVLEILFSPIM